jgi:predicted Na+-dependent transporter
MRICATVLNWFGANAPVLLLASLVVGALAPSAAALSEAALPIAAFLMMFGSLVAAGLAPFERPNGVLRLGMLILVVAAGPSIAAALVVEVLGLADDLALGVVLSVAGPPAASAAALAVILGLPPRFALALSILPTLLCPLTTPVPVDVFAGEAVDPVVLAVKLVSVVGVASLAATTVLAFMRKSDDRANASLAASGVSMIGLVGVGIAAAARARVEAEVDLAGFGVLILGALILCASLGLIGALAFAALGCARAGTLSLVWAFAIRVSFGRLSARRCRSRRSGSLWRWSCPS